MISTNHERWSINLNFTRSSMRVVFTFVAILLFSVTASSQVFTGTGGSIPGTSTTQTCFTRNVTGVGVINRTYGLASVCITITHPNVDELEIVLTAPDGTVVPLSIQNGGSGNNYTNTCFTATATTPIKFGTAPFNGSYLPEGYIGAVNNGQNANGAWRLCIQDRRTGANAGVLNTWSLTFNNTPAPVPPARPACVNNLPTNSSCATAALVCDFNGQCGTTSGSTVQDWTGSGLDGCFGLQNNSFIRFIAAATTASFSVWVPTSTQANYNQGGIQMLFFSGTCNSGPVTTYGCYPHILPYSGSGQPLITVVTASGLTPGNTYYLMIDGFNNDNNTFTIAANTGVNVLNVTPPAPAICEGGSVNLTATGGNGVYSWSPNTNLNTTSGATVTASPTGTITYTVSSTTATGCPLTKDVTVTVNPLPAAPAATVTQPTCTTPTGTITITAPLGAGLTYSVNGGPYQPSPVFTGLAPGVTYTVTVQNAAGCFANTPFTVNAAPPTPAAPTGTITQPTCTVPTGTITITTPTGAGLQYSINGGPYQPSPVFSGLTPGSYTLTVQNAAGCTSPASTPFVLNAAPNTPAAPTGTITQPTCTTPTGTINITAPTGAGLQYSINGGPYQASPVFTGLTPASYTITVQNAAGCTSPASLPLVVNAAPVTPAVPTATVIQPTCTVTTGTITITAPTGAGMQYSINGGPYQSSPVFTGLVAGLYTLTAQNAAGCTSPSSGTLSVSSPPVIPGTPTANVTQPNCTIQTGTITVITPTGPGLQYSINGGPYQASPVFTGLAAPGSYTIVAQHTSGCTSPTSLPFVVSALPVIPATPTVSVIQPTCTVTTATITVTSPVGAGLEYSIGGVNYQSSPVFANLPNTNTYTVFVKSVDGCIASVPVTVNGLPGQAPPVATVVQPDCTTPTGTITITSPLGAQYIYGIRNAATTILTGPQASPVFTGVIPGTYMVIVQAGNGNNCLSVTTVTVNPSAVPAAATANVTEPTCTTPTGTITVTAPTGADLEYSISGGAYQSSPVFNNLSPANYTIVVRNTVSGCVSDAQPFTVNNVPGLPAMPTLATLQPNCSRPAGSISVLGPLGTDLEYSINGGTYQASPIFPGLAQGSYSIKVRNKLTGCESQTANSTINQPQLQPIKPVVVTTQPSCPARVGEIRVNAPVGSDVEYSINGTNYQASNIFPNLAGGNYTVTARFTGTTCVSEGTPVQILTLTAEQCLQPSNGDIYFPSAFTPNGDGRNDGFGPGPKTNLANVTGYTLMVFNRYGEKVFETNDPLVQWNGTYKGKMLANYSYTWVAKYRYGTRPVQVQKGSVTVIR